MSIPKLDCSDFPPFLRKPHVRAILAKHGLPHGRDRTNSIFSSGKIKKIRINGRDEATTGDWLQEYLEGEVVGG